MFRIAKLTQKFFNSRHAVLDTIFCKSKSAKYNYQFWTEVQNCKIYKKFIQF